MNSRRKCNPFWILFFQDFEKAFNVKSQTKLALGSRLSICPSVAMSLLDLKHTCAQGYYKMGLYRNVSRENPTAVLTAFHGTTCNDWGDQIGKKSNAQFSVK